MPSADLDAFSRTTLRNGKPCTTVTPGLAVVLYTDVALSTATAAAADVLEAYLDFVPAHALAATFVFGDDAHGDALLPFDAQRRQQLLHDLRDGPPCVDDEGWDFVLTGALDGQASGHGVRFRGTTVPDPEDYPDETSLLRLELPWNLLDTVDVEAVVDFIHRVARLFPFCTGHAGFSFHNTVVFEAQARAEVATLVPQLLGFDSAYDWMSVYMGGHAAPAHWVQLLDTRSVERLGGRARLAAALPKCRLTDLPNGLMIRAAKLPPVGDTTRGAADLGRLPALARALAPLAYDDPSEVGLGDEAAGNAYLRRFDSLEPGAWNNDE
jgi:hypothetical protein